MATIRDIARETGLSIATVSKCLNGQQVKPENKEAIFAAVDRLHYLPNGTARSMRTQSNKLIPIIVPTMAHVMIPETVMECSRLLIKQGYYPTVCVTGGDPELEKSYLLKLASHQMEGILSMPTCTDEKIYRCLDVNGIPYVFFEQDVPGMEANTVHLSGDVAIAALAEAARDAGHRLGGAILGHKDSQACQRQYGKIKSIINSYGYYPSDDYVIFTDFTVKGGQEAMSRLLALPEPPSIVFCLGEELTVGAYGSIMHHGLKIPDNIGLIGIQNTSVLDAVSPELKISALVEPTDTLAKVCVDRLLELIRLKSEGKNVTENIIHKKIPLEYIRGDTI